MKHNFSWRENVNFRLKYENLSNQTRIIRVNMKQKRI